MAWWRRRFLLAAASSNTCFLRYSVAVVLQQQARRMRCSQRQHDSSRSTGCTLGSHSGSGMHPCPSASKLQGLWRGLQGFELQQCN